MNSFFLGNLWSPANKGDLGIAQGIINAMVSLGYDPSSSYGGSILPISHSENRLLAYFLGLVDVVGNYLTPEYLVPEGLASRIMGKFQVLPLLMQIQCELFFQSPLRWAERYIPKEILNMDTLWVMTGGSALYANGARGSLARVTRITMWPKIGIGLHRKVIFAPQSLGPIGNKEDAKRLLSVLKDAHAILIRESASYNMLKMLGIPQKKVFLAPDSAWLVTPCETASVNTKIGASGDLCGISWRHSPEVGQGENEKRLLEIIEGVRALGLTPVLVAHVTGPTRGEDDGLFLKKIAYKTKTLFIDTSDLLPGECISLYSRFSVAIGMRFHFCLFCMLGNVPVIGLSYRSPKHLGTFQDIGIPEYAFAKDFQANQVVKAVTNILKDRKRVLELVQTYKEKAKRQLLQILGVVLQ